jgi:hypothetical protein
VDSIPGKLGIEPPHRTHLPSTYHSYPVPSSSTMASSSSRRALTTLRSTLSSSRSSSSSSSSSSATKLAAPSLTAYVPTLDLPSSSIITSNPLFTNPSHVHINHPSRLFPRIPESSYPELLDQNSPAIKEQILSSSTGLSTDELRGLYKNTVVLKRVSNMTKKGKMYVGNLLSSLILRWLSFPSFKSRY